MERRQPIGIFDSGIGGLTVAKAILKALPHEDTIYFGDTAHLPYGDKSKDTVARYSKDIVDFLLERQCKAIVIACNTASAMAFDELRQYVPSSVPIVNVIDPMVSYVTSHGFTSVGVIATKSTVSSDIYAKKIRSSSDVTVKSLATPLLVPMIEEGFHNGDISRMIIENYLSDPILQDIDGLVLGCTHYPLIHSEIDEYYNGKVKVLDSTLTIVDSVTEILNQRTINSPKDRVGTHEFYVSDYTDSFMQTTRLFYGDNIELQQVKIN